MAPGWTGHKTSSANYCTRILVQQLYCLSARYGLCTQLRIETPLRISEHELLVILGYNQLTVRVPSKMLLVHLPVCLCAQ